MDTTIIVALIGAFGAIIAAYIGATRATKTQVDKSVKRIRENLPTWELLFEHDENGNQISGTIESLIEAAGKAYPLKVKIFREKNRFEMMDAQRVFVDENVVHATNIDQISLGKDSTGNYKYFEDAYHYYVLVNSTGFHHAARIYPDGRKRQATDS